MPSGFNRVSTLDKYQKGAYADLFQQAGMQNNPLYQQGSNYLQQLLSGSPEAFQAFEAPAMRQFQEQIIPALAERFAGMGAGAQSSSAFQQALGQSAAGLSENLAQLRSSLQMNAIPQALGYAQQPFQNMRSLFDIQSQAFLPKQQPFWQTLLAGLASGGGAALGQGAGLGALKFMGAL